MKAVLVREMRRTDKTLSPAGTVIDHPDAYKLVRLGVAEPADDECRERCGMTPERMKAAQAAAARAEAGIHPEDHEAYAKGWMVGYQKNDKAPQRDALGNTSNIWEPGPQWAEYASLLEARENEILDDEEEDE